MTGDGQDLELVNVNDGAAWRHWLERHHAGAPGAWLAVARKGVRGITYAEAVEEALCFGWIDSRPNALDEGHYKLRFSPRRPKSVWSKLNKERVERLVAEGRMTPAGLALTEAAKADGSWGTLDAVDALAVPEDLAAGLAANRTAKRHFDAFPPSSKKMILFWIQDAKRPETREKRIAETVRLAERNERANHWRP